MRREAARSTARGDSQVSVHDDVGRASPSSEHFDPRSRSRGAQRPIPRHEGRIQRLGQREIGGVVSREVVPQLPDALQQNVVRIPVERKIGEIAQRLTAPFGRDQAQTDVPAQNRRRFNVEQVRCAEDLVRRENPLTYTSGCGCLQQNFKDGRRIHDDQRLILSARTAAAGASLGWTGWRPANRVLISSSVGRSREERSSRRR
jgi:hypothetical protein